MSLSEPTLGNHDANGFISAYQPPLSERIWRWLGYHRPYVDRPEETADFPSYFVTVTTVTLSWPDRLRLLVSGKLCIEALSQTDVEVKQARTISDASVIP